MPSKGVNYQCLILKLRLPNTTEINGILTWPIFLVAKIYFYSAIHEVLQNLHINPSEWLYYLLDNFTLYFKEPFSFKKKSEKIVSIAIKWKGFAMLHPKYYFELLNETWMRHAEASTHNCNTQKDTMFSESWSLALFFTWGTPNQSSACCMASRALSTGFFGSQVSQSGQRPEETIED